MPAPENQNKAQTHYEVLGVSRDATADQIKKAHHKLVLQLHPDRNYGKEAAATEKFKDVQKSYEILMDAEKRKSYDLELERAEREKARKQQQASAPSYVRPTAPQQAPRAQSQQAPRAQSQQAPRAQSQQAPRAQSQQAPRSTHYASAQHKNQPSDAFKAKPYVRVTKVRFVPSEYCRPTSQAQAQPSTQKQNAHRPAPHVHGAAHAYERPHHLNSVLIYLMMHELVKQRQAQIILVHHRFPASKPLLKQVALNTINVEFVRNMESLLLFNSRFSAQFDRRASFVEQVFESPTYRRGPR